MTAQLDAALARWVATFSAGDTCYDNAVHFTCSEVDSIVALLAAAGDREAAEMWVEAHRDNEDEEEGDSHFELATEDITRYVDNLIGGRP